MNTLALLSGAVGIIGCVVGVAIEIGLEGHKTPIIIRATCAYL